MGEDIRLCVQMDLLIMMWEKISDFCRARVPDYDGGEGIRFFVQLGLQIMM